MADADRRPAARSSYKMIRWGILGCGAVTEVKSGPAFQQTANSTLGAVMRRDGKHAADYARRHGVPRWYDHAQELVADTNVDAIYVATPPGAHLEGVLLAASAGKPVYVEKPMARNAAECSAMIQACREAGVPLFVAYYRRALPRFLKVRALLAEDAIGTLTSVSYRYTSSEQLNIDPAQLPWRLQARHSGGGLFLDLGSHTLDILDFLLGPLREIQGQAANLAGRAAVEDTVAMTFRTAADALGTATWNFAAALSEDEIEFTGTLGRIRLSTFGNGLVRLETAAGMQVFDLPNPLNIQQPLIQTIVNSLLGNGCCPSTGESAQRTSIAMDIVLRGYYGDRDSEFWERESRWSRARSTYEAP